MDFLNTPLSHIVQTVPGASAVFNDYKLNFCCGGQHTLIEATAKTQLDPEEVVIALKQLTAKVNSSQKWNTLSNEALVEHMLVQVHQVSLVQLKELIRLAERVEKVHGNKDHCPLGLAKHLQVMKKLIERQYQQKESQFFPMLLGATQVPNLNPIHEMKTFHKDNELAFNQIDHLTNSISPPEGACNTWRALYLGLEHFKADMEENIDIENRVLFSRFS